MRLLRHEKKREKDRKEIDRFYVKIVLSKILFSSPWYLK